MSEDCLYANVYTTENCLREKNCPVMYYIFGGAWDFNSPFTLGESTMIENYNAKDIILITMTYRMNSFGFFNTAKRTSAIKNLGLWDMIVGLQWTQREIHNFGGDKSRVSIMGHSSGAEASDLLAISPKTDGLFHQIIPLSGSSLAMDLRPDGNIAASRALAVETGCATEALWDAGNTFENILTCMRNKSTEEMIAAQKKVEENGQRFPGPNIDEPDGVLPENSRALSRKRRPYRTMIGTTNRESRATKIIFGKDGNINRRALYATCVMMAKRRGFNHTAAVGRACADDYSKRPTDIPDLFDDTEYYLPAYETGETLRSKGATVYKYSFEYENIGAAIGASLKAPGGESPAHAEDLVYVMGLTKGKFTKKDDKIQQIYGGMFADFIKMGDPSQPNYDKWQPTDDRNNYFKIDFDDNMNMPGNTDGYHANPVQFWIKKAPEVDKFVSKWDVNGTFSYRKFAEELFQGLKQMGINVSPDLQKEFEDWKNNGQGWSKERTERFQQMLDDLLHWIQNPNDRNDHYYDNWGRNTTVKPYMNQAVPQIREETIVVSTNWRTWFWVMTGISIVLAVILMLVTCSICYQQSKRREYERLNESTRLIQTSVKTYG
uniref:Carboxylic ester hydrolase n=1 Tax=Plectus sambesii TaxID=2011161 RepID=A0A914WDR9_9BILA